MQWQHLRPFLQSAVVVGSVFKMQTHCLVTSVIKKTIDEGVAVPSLHVHILHSAMVIDLMIMMQTYILSCYQCDYTKSFKILLR